MWCNEQRRNLQWEAEGIESSIGITAPDGLSFVVNGKNDGNAIGDAGTQIGVATSARRCTRHPKTGLVIGLGTGESAGWLASMPGDRAGRRRGAGAGDRRNGPALERLESQRAQASEGSPHLQRRPRACLHDRREVRRDHLRAVEPVSCRRGLAIHARVLPRSARSADAGRHVHAMGAGVRGGRFHGAHGAGHGPERVRARRGVADDSRRLASRLLAGSRLGIRPPSCASGSRSR